MFTLIDEDHAKAVEEKFNYRLNLEQCFAGLAFSVDLDQLPAEVTGSGSTDPAR